MKKIIFFSLLISLSQKYFSQNGFCMNILPDPTAGSYCSPALAKADFNNDGQVDVCIQSVDAFFATTFGVGILLSNGTGSYSSFPTYSLSTDRIILVTAGDFTNDGNQDVIAVCKKDSAFFLLAGNGAGGFISKTTFTTPTVPNAMVAADFNNDGKLDIAYSCLASQSVSIMYAGATGLLNPVNYSLGSVPAVLVPGDFNNDNLPDLFVLAGTPSYFLQGAANGIFTVINNLNLNATNVIAEDVDSDNKLDLICTDIINNRLSTLKGNGNFTFATPFSYSVTGIGGVLGLGPVACADFNNDGKKDVLTVSSDTSTRFITILPGIGNGSFSAPVTYSLGFNSGFNLLYNFVVADFNNDNKPDIISLVGDWGANPFCSFKLFENCNAVNVGIKETGNNGTNFNLFPNPTGDFLQVQIEEMNEAEFRTCIIYNNVGQIVIEKKLIFENEKTIIKTDDLPNGIYTLQLKSSNATTVSKRFVVAK